MDKKVIIPEYLLDGVQALKQGFPKRPKLFVFDVETDHGNPYLLIVYDGVNPKYFRVDRTTIAENLLEYLNGLCSTGTTNVLFSHNLQFDLTAVFDIKREVFGYLKPPFLLIPDKDTFMPSTTVRFDKPKPKYGVTLPNPRGTPPYREIQLGKGYSKLVRVRKPKENDVEMVLGAYDKITIYCQSTWFAQIRLRNRANVKVIDSNNFIRGSLYNLSRELNFRFKKRKRPRFVEEGRKPRNRKEWKELYRYCGEEIKAEYELAQFILQMHKKYDVGMTVSSAHFASKVFRKPFLKTTIPQVPLHIKPLVEASIHGGRADVFVKAPVVIPNVRMYDVNSFYPWALANLPPITKGKWIEVNGFVEEHEGFYWITGHVKPCRWPIIIKSMRKFQYANDEHVENIAISSYELREALNNREFVPEKIEGYIWIPDKDATNPFRDYVEEFFRLKNKSEDDTSLKVMYKLLLNSLYGKTYQTIRLTDYEETSQWIRDENTGVIRKNEIRYRAGGIYLPHVGAWVTSMCRARLHQLMHQHEAIDCATDSFKTTKKAELGKKLGELKIEAEGLLLLIRPKLYVMLSKEGQKEVFEKYNGDLREYLKQNLQKLGLQREIVKYALHSFWGDVYTLLELYADKGTEYIVKHMTKIKESLRQRKQPRVMEIQKRHVKIDWSKEKQIMPCGLTKEEAIKQKELCNENCGTCAYTVF